MKSNVIVEVSEKRLCVCDDNNKKLVYIDSIEGVGTEFETLDGLYCKECNSFWREP